MSENGFTLETMMSRIGRGIANAFRDYVEVTRRCYLCACPGSGPEREYPELPDNRDDQEQQRLRREQAEHDRRNRTVRHQSDNVPPDGDAEGG
ncbi:MAG: hypothetical protein ABIH90_00215 [Candidatus Aenigmatarchaeota archaeon]